MRGSHAWLRPGAVLVAAMAVAVAWPAGALGAAQYPPVRYENYQHVLPSGLRVVVYQLGGARLASIAVSYLGGHLAEPAGKEGVAEVTLRLSSGLAGMGEGEGFGETRRPSIGQRLLGDTTRFDGSVETESVVFWARAPANRVKAVLDLEAERMADPLAGIGKEHFERVRAMLLEEVTGEERRPSRNAEKWTALASVLPPGLNRPRPASRESVQAITWEDVKAYAAATFRPERAIVAVVGPANVRETGRAVVAAFAPPPGVGQAPVQPSARATGPAFPAPESRPLATFPGPVARPRLWLAWMLPFPADLEGSAAVQSATLIGTLMVRASSPGAGKAAVLSPDFLGGVLLLSCAIDLERAEDADKVLAGLARVSMPPWTPGPLQTVREIGHLLFYRGLENLPASSVAEMVRSQDRLDPVGEAQDRFLQPASETTWRQASTWVRREAVLAVLELPEATGAAASDLVPGPKGEERAERADGEAVPPWMNRLPAGKYDVYSMAQPPGLSAAWRESMENGLEVIGLQRPGYPKIAARLSLRRTVQGPATMPQVALGARAPRPPRAPPCPVVAPEVGTSAIVWSRDVPSGSMDRALDDLSCNVVEFQFDRGEFARRRDREVERLKRREKASGRSANQAAAASDHAFDPASRSEEPSAAEELDDVSKGDAEDWVRDQLRPDRATLILVGDLPPQEQVMVAIAPRFRNWKAPPESVAAPRPSGAPAPPSRRSVFVGDVGSLRNAMVMIQVRWSPAERADGPAEDVVVMEAERRVRREHRHGVRKVHVHRGTDPWDPFLHVHFEVQPARTGEATRKVLDALATLAEAPALAENVAFARWMMARRFPDRFATIDGLAQGLASQVGHGLPPDWWDRYPASISGLGTDRVEAAARRLAVGREVVLVHGPRETIAPSLVAAGLAVEKPGS